MQRDLEAVGLQSKQHANYIDDFENRLRRNNLRVIGFPGSTEGNNITEFMEQWLLKNFEKNSFFALFFY